MLDAEFDKYADKYLADHAANLKISGEEPAYFARYKIDELRRVWTARGYREPDTMLDFGSGIGASLPHLARAFPHAALTAYDVSPRSLEIARRSVGAIAEFVHGESLDALGSRTFDLVFTSCVFHHIEADQHVDLLGRLRRLLTPDGIAIVFEHNPLNPVTRYIVATCPFDENAVLLSARTLRARQRAAGFSRVETHYTGFFPAALARLRVLEPHISWCPIGAQYYTLAHA